MAKFEVNDSSMKDFFDVVVEVGFESPLNPVDTIQVLRAFLGIITSKIAPRFFEGLTSLEINASSLKTCFRFSRRREGGPDSSGYWEDLSRQRAQFIFYLFAKIDSQYRLADIPFPSSFREFLSFPDYIHDDA